MSIPPCVCKNRKQFCHKWFTLKWQWREMAWEKFANDFLFSSQMSRWTPITALEFSLVIPKKVRQCRQGLVLVHFTSQWVPGAGKCLFTFQEWQWSMGDYLPGHPASMHSAADDPGYTTRSDPGWGRGHKVTVQWLIRSYMSRSASKLCVQPCLTKRTNDVSKTVDLQQFETHAGTIEPVCQNIMFFPSVCVSTLWKLCKHDEDGQTESSPCLSYLWHA